MLQVDDNCTWVAGDTVVGKRVALDGTTRQALQIDTGLVVARAITGKGVVAQREVAQADRCKRGTGITAVQSTTTVVGEGVAFDQHVACHTRAMNLDTQTIAAECAVAHNHVVGGVGRINAHTR